MADNSSIVDKIKALFSLSTSSNQHEAELALQKAHELIEKYDVSMEDIVNSEIEERVNSSATRRPQFEQTLSIYSAMMFNCRTYLGRDGLKIHFVGLPEKAEMARMLFIYLKESCRASSDLHSRQASFRNSFGIGFALAIKARVLELVAKNEEASSNRKELVLVETGMVDKYMEKLNLNKGGSANFSIKDDTGFSQGLAKGKDIPFNSIGTQTDLKRISN